MHRSSFEGLKKSSVESVRTREAFRSREGSQDNCSSVESMKRTSLVRLPSVAVRTTLLGNRLRVKQKEDLAFNKDFLEPLKETHQNSCETTLLDRRVKKSSALITQTTFHSYKRLKSPTYRNI